MKHVKTGMAINIFSLTIGLIILLSGLFFGLGVLAVSMMGPEKMSITERWQMVISNLVYSQTSATALAVIWIAAGLIATVAGTWKMVIKNVKSNTG